MIDEPRIARLREELGAQLFNDLTDLLLRDMHRGIAALAEAEDPHDSLDGLAQTAGGLGLSALSAALAAAALDDTPKAGELAALLEASCTAMERCGLRSAA